MVRSNTKLCVSKTNTTQRKKQRKKQISNMSKSKETYRKKRKQEQVHEPLTATKSQGNENSPLPLSSKSLKHCTATCKNSKRCSSSTSSTNGSKVQEVPFSKSLQTDPSEGSAMTSPPPTKSPKYSNNTNKASSSSIVGKKCQACDSDVVKRGSIQYSLCRNCLRACIRCTPSIWYNPEEFTTCEKSMIGKRCENISKCMKCRIFKCVKQKIFDQIRTDFEGKPCTVCGRESAIILHQKYVCGSCYFLYYRLNKSECRTEQACAAAEFLQMCKSCQHLHAQNIVGRIQRVPNNGKGIRSLPVSSVRTSDVTIKKRKPVKGEETSNVVKRDCKPSKTVTRTSAESVNIIGHLGEPPEVVSEKSTNSLKRVTRKYEKSLDNITQQVETAKVVESNQTKTPKPVMQSLHQSEQTRISPERKKRKRSTSVETSVPSDIGKDIQSIVLPVSKKFKHMVHASSNGKSKRINAERRGSRPSEEEVIETVNRFMGKKGNVKAIHNTAVNATTPVNSGLSSLTSSKQPSEVPMEVDTDPANFLDTLDVIESPEHGSITSNLESIPLLESTEVPVEGIPADQCSNVQTNDSITLTNESVLTITSKGNSANESVLDIVPTMENISESASASAILARSVGYITPQYESASSITSYTKRVTPGSASSYSNCSVNIEPISPILLKKYTSCKLRALRKLSLQSSCLEGQEVMGNELACGNIQNNVPIYRLNHGLNTDQEQKDKDKAKKSKTAKDVDVESEEISSDTVEKPTEDVTNRRVIRNDNQGNGQKSLIQKKDELKETELCSEWKGNSLSSKVCSSNVATDRFSINSADKSIVPCSNKQEIGTTNSTIISLTTNELKKLKNDYISKDCHLKIIRDATQSDASEEVLSDATECVAAANLQELVSPYTSPPFRSAVPLPNRSVPDHHVSSGIPLTLTSIKYTHSLTPILYNGNDTIHLQSASYNTPSLSSTEGMPTSPDSDASDATEMVKSWESSPEICTPVVVIPKSVEHESPNNVPIPLSSAVDDTDFIDELSKTRVNVCEMYVPILQSVELDVSQKTTLNHRKRNVSVSSYDSDSSSSSSGSSNSNVDSNSQSKTEGRLTFVASVNMSNLDDNSISDDVEKNSQEDDEDKTPVDKLIQSSSESTVKPSDNSTVNSQTKVTAITPVHMFNHDDLDYSEEEEDLHVTSQEEVTSPKPTKISDSLSHPHRVISHTGSPYVSHADEDCDPFAPSSPLESLAMSDSGEDSLLSAPESPDYAGSTESEGAEVTPTAQRTPIEQSKSEQCIDNKNPLSSRQFSSREIDKKSTQSFHLKPPSLDRIPCGKPEPSPPHSPEEDVADVMSMFVGEDYDHFISDGTSMMGHNRLTFERSRPLVISDPVYSPGKNENKQPITFHSHTRAIPSDSVNNHLPTPDLQLPGCTSQRTRSQYRASGSDYELPAFDGNDERLFEVSESENIPPASNSSVYSNPPIQMPQFPIVTDNIRMTTADIILLFETNKAAAKKQLESYSASLSPTQVRLLFDELITTKCPLAFDLINLLKPLGSQDIIFFNNLFCSFREVANMSSELFGVFRFLDDKKIDMTSSLTPESIESIMTYFISIGDINKLSEMFTMLLKKRQYYIPESVVLVELCSFVLAEPSTRVKPLQTFFTQIPADHVFQHYALKAKFDKVMVAIKNVNASSQGSTRTSGSQKSSEGSTRRESNISPLEIPVLPLELPLRTAPPNVMLISYIIQNKMWRELLQRMEEMQNSVQHTNMVLKEITDEFVKNSNMFVELLVFLEFRVDEKLLQPIGRIGSNVVFLNCKKGAYNHSHKIVQAFRKMNMDVAEYCPIPPYGFSSGRIAMYAVGGYIEVKNFDLAAQTFLCYCSPSQKTIAFQREDLQYGHDMFCELMKEYIRLENYDQCLRLFKTLKETEGRFSKIARDETDILRNKRTETEFYNVLLELSLNNSPDCFMKLLQFGENYCLATQVDRHIKQTIIKRYIEKYGFADETKDMYKYLDLYAGRFNPKEKSYPVTLTISPDCSIDEIHLAIEYTFELIGNYIIKKDVRSIKHNDFDFQIRLPLGNTQNRICKRIPRTMQIETDLEVVSSSYIPSLGLAWAKDVNSAINADHPKISKYYTLLPQAIYQHVANYVNKMGKQDRMPMSSPPQAEQRHRSSKHTYQDSYRNRTRSNEYESIDRSYSRQSSLPSIASLRSSVDVIDWFKKCPDAHGGEDADVKGPSDQRNIHSDHPSTKNKTISTRKPLLKTPVIPEKQAVSSQVRNKDVSPGEERLHVPSANEILIPLFEPPQRTKVVFTRTFSQDKSADISSVTKRLCLSTKDVQEPQPVSPKNVMSSTVLEYVPVEDKNSKISLAKKKLSCPLVNKVGIVSLDKASVSCGMQVHSGHSAIESDKSTFPCIKNQKTVPAVSNIIKTSSSSTERSRITFSSSKEGQKVVSSDKIEYRTTESQNQSVPFTEKTSAAKKKITILQNPAQQVTVCNAEDAHSPQPAMPATLEKKVEMNSSDMITGVVNVAPSESKKPKFQFRKKLQRQSDNLPFNVHSLPQNEQQSREELQSIKITLDTPSDVQCTRKVLINRPKFK